MILIISHKDDFTTDYIVNKLNERKVKYLRFNTDDIEQKHRLTFEISDSNIKASIDGYESFNSAWFRRTKSPLIGLESIIEQEVFRNDYSAFLKSFWKIIGVKKWLSNPEKISIAENKLAQLKMATEIGLNVPNTQISNKIESVNEFINHNKKNVIVKPFFSGRLSDGHEQKLIFTNELNLDDINEDYFLFPIFFQNNLEKDFELRITVVGDKVFPAKVNSQSTMSTKIDWRRDRLKFEKAYLPPEIESHCVKLIKLFDLKFGAIDMVKTQSGEYIFLEMNPNGQWVWIEAGTGLKISDEIIKFLMN